MSRIMDKINLAVLILVLLTFALMPLLGAIQSGFDSTGGFYSHTY